MTSDAGPRQWLRQLPTFDRDHLPPFDPEATPAGPTELYLDWLHTAADAGLAAPHAVNLATADANGQVTARTVILKDLYEHTWCIATSALSPKAAQLVENPRAALTSFWAPLGRQVRITGSVTDLGDAAADEDFHARPDGSRAAALVGQQSQVLPDRQTYAEAFAAALEQVQQHPRTPLPTWRVYGLQAESVEFWQATADSGQTRLHYRRTGTDWHKELLWP
ncbi:pyridoxine/pyridoxamine 5'-phosphate oxidase [Ruania albidiflava]|uniref:pyridoxine/pyridoxamine 5'-phosphate oxidase n=1 Tax=Ruania albidiflava TaxID=366586 RepID=UPI0023F35692|nr:pyridoxal 5'-phosphate synthase [Ruania albidiflava]